jgi:hypothetical protein
MEQDTNATILRLSPSVKTCDGEWILNMHILGLSIHSPVYFYFQSSQGEGMPFFWAVPTMHVCGSGPKKDLKNFFILLDGPPG